MRRQEFLGVAVASFLAMATSGCDNSVNRPNPLPIPNDLPVSVSWKYGETVLTDGTTEVKVPRQSPFFVTGELQPKQGESLSRYPMGYIVPADFSIPPIPDPKNINKPFVDKPDDLHIYLFLALSSSGRDRTQEKPVGSGFVNQLVPVDGKKLIFSGGIMSPNEPGTYVLRLFGSFKPEKDCSSRKDRTSVGDPRLMREITLIVEDSKIP